MEQWLERIQKMMEPMILEQNEFSKKLSGMVTKISIWLGADLNSSSSVHNVKRVEENSTTLVETLVSNKLTSDVATPMEEEVVRQRNNFMSTLRTQSIQQVHALKLRVLSSHPKVQGVFSSAKLKFVGTIIPNNLLTKWQN